MTNLHSWNSEELKKLELEVKKAHKEKEVDEILNKIRSWKITKYFFFVILIASIFWFIFRVNIAQETVQVSRLDDYYQRVMEDSYIDDSVLQRYSVIVSDTLKNKNVGFRIVINFKN